MRIHLAQIWYRPAYFDQGVDYLAEPHVSVESCAPLGLLSQIPSIEEFLHDSKAAYITHITQKLRAIIEWSASRGADILVFPEYSVPIECVALLRELATNHEMMIVAGSHRVRMSPESDVAYRALSVDLARPGAALCPILLPNGNTIMAPKLSQSKWEPSLVIEPSRSPTKFEVDLCGTRITCGLLLCIDSLRLPLAGRLLDTPKPEVVLCPSLSPAVDPFKDVGSLASLSETLFCYANEASHGGSFFNLPEQWSPFIEGGRLDGSDLPPHCEAVLELLVDPTFFFQKKGTLSSSPKASRPMPFQVVYDRDFDQLSALSQLRSDLNTWIVEHKDVSTGIEWLDSFLTEYSYTLPPVLQKNLRELRHRVLPFFDGTAQPIVDATEVIRVTQTQSTLAVFAQSTKRAIAILSAYLGDYDTEQLDQVLECLRALKGGQRKLPPAAVDDGFGRDVPPANLMPVHERLTPLPADVSHFQNRGQELDVLKGFFADPETRLIVLTGPLGIGKSDLTNVIFPKQLVDWSPIKITIPAGARVPRLIAEVAYHLGMSFDVDSLSTASHHVFRSKVRKLLQRFFEKPRRALIIDDLNQILRHATVRDVRHLSIFIEEACAVETVVGGKILLLSSQWLKVEWLNRKGLKHLALKRIQDLYVIRIIEFALRRAGVVNAEAVPETPPELLDVIKGHPLSAKLAVESLQPTGFQELVRGLKAVASSGYIAQELLRHATLTEPESTVLRKISVFRLPVRVDLMRKVHSLSRDIDLLAQLSTRSIIGFDGVAFELHEAVRRYFYSEIRPQEKAAFHRGALDYYRAIYDVTVFPRSDIRDPSVVCELIHHLVMAGRKVEATYLRDIVVDELKQTARYIYREVRDYDRALELYRLMADLVPDDLEVIAYIGRCYARRRMWQASDDAFQDAISLASKNGKRVGWLHRDWGHIRVRYQFYPEARRHLEAALEHEPEDPSTFSALAYLSWKEGDYKAAANYFDRALSFNPDHVYTLTYYPRFLRQRGESGYAAELEDRLRRHSEDQRYVSRLEDVEELEYDDE